MTEDTMSVVSWIHDNANVDDVTYGDEDVLVDFQARPAVISQARSRASELHAHRRSRRKRRNGCSSNRFSAAVAAQPLPHL